VRLQKHEGYFLVYVQSIELALIKPKLLKELDLLSLPLLPFIVAKPNSKILVSCAEVYSFSLIRISFLQVFEGLESFLTSIFEVQTQWIQAFMLFCRNKRSLELLSNMVELVCPFFSKNLHFALFNLSPQTSLKVSNICTIDFYSSAPLVLRMIL